MKRGKIGIVIVVTSLVVTLMLAISCVPKGVPESAPTSTSSSAVKPPESISFWTIGDMSGPYATVMVPLRPSLSDCIEYVNTKMGGVKGVPIKWDIKDNGGKMDVCLAQYEELRTMVPKPTFVAGWVTAQNEALRERFAEDKIPFICTTSAKAIYPAAYSFGFHISYADAFGGFVDWLRETWKGDGNPKLAILTWDTAFGRGCVTDECYAYAKAKGVDVVATELFPMMSMDVTTELLRIREKNPDWIYTNTLTIGPPTIMKSAKTMGYQIRLGGNYSIGWDCIRLAGPGALDGVIQIREEASWDDTSNPAMQKLTEMFVAHSRKPIDRDQVYISPWNYTLMGVEAMTKAVDEVGWKGFNGEAVYNQMIKLNSFAPLGGLGNFTYTKEMRSPNKAYMAEIRDGRILPISGWRTIPDLRPSGPWTPSK